MTRCARCICMALMAVAALLLPAKAEQTAVTVGVRQNMQATLVTPDGRSPIPPSWCCIPAAA